MRNREAVRTRYPRAWATHSAQVGQWVVMRGTNPEMRIGIGETPQKAWASAIKTLGFAEGIRKWHDEKGNS